MQLQTPSVGGESILRNLFEIRFGSLISLSQFVVAGYSFCIIHEMVIWLLPIAFLCNRYYNCIHCKRAELSRAVDRMFRFVDMCNE